MDAMKLLGGLLGGGMNGGGLFGGSESTEGASSGGLGDMLGGLLGGAGSGGAGNLLSSTLGGLLGGGSSETREETESSGGSSMMPLITLAIGAAGHFLGKLGSNDQAAQATAPRTVPDYQAPQDDEINQQAVHLIKSMVAAAYADGRLDEAERAAITQRMEALQLDDEERAFISNELLSPAGVEEIIEEVNGREQALQTYAVSLISVTVDTAQEKEFLAQLAQGLGITPEDRINIAQQLGLI